MTDMIEKVAMAIHKAVVQHPYTIHPDNMFVARAAIEAMREPDAETRLAGARSIGETMRTENHTVRSWKCWQAMIDKALESD